ncbi:transglutaminase domain-containing protein [Leucobacter sp. CSA1]|uniref:Transglutaminase domain-containing protein n=1 Tax=Leucobacter chromiisoli TaxID=2796471 RepID=A0A934UVT2_9MICO|nr:transglutaminase domain-containing protein [Leucobacter chromiisoli]MBK0420245.1 transglutaminase domain-containing protein [Leucobacter chromiisoli]
MVERGAGTAARRPRAPGARATPSRWRPLVGSILLFALWAVALAVLGEVFTGSLWTIRALILTGAITLGAGLAAASLPRRRALSWVLGASAGAALLLWWAERSGSLELWLTDPRLAVQEIGIAVAEGVPPVEPAGAFLDALLLGWSASVALASLILVRQDLLFLAGVVPASWMLVPSIIVSIRAPAPLLACAGALLLLLLWAGAPRGGRWTGLVSAGLALALAAGLLAVTPPTRDRVWNSGAVSASPVSPGVPDVTVALGEDLRGRSDAVVFRYQGLRSGESVRFTLAVLSEFERGTWLPQEALEPGNPSVETPREPPAGEWAQWDPTSETPRHVQQVTVRNEGLVSPWLPLPRGAELVEPAGPRGASSFEPSRWRWVDGTWTARSESTLTRRGDEYRALGRALEADDLSRLLSPGAALDAPPPEFDAFLELPDGIPAAVSEAAAEATAGANGPVEAANALLTLFRSGEFVYDEEAPYDPGANRGDPYAVMESFLEQRRGYCVHYASTFSVMARTLGIPSRVAVGYASRAQSTEWTSVRSRELHAWPEIYVGGVGWVAYEPTPGGAGLRADQGEQEDRPVSGPEAPAPAETPEEPREPAERPEARQQPGEEELPEQPADAAGETGGGAGILLGLGATVLALACLAPALIRWILRRLRLRRVRRGPEPASAAWAELVDAARDLGFLGFTGGAEDRARARTPEAVVEHLVGRGLLGARGTAAADAADRLALAVVGERYSGDPPGGPGPGAGAGSGPGAGAGSGAEGLASDLIVAIRALRAGAGPKRRLRAAVLPRTVLSRTAFSRRRSSGR